ncbi:MAG: ComF family protein [Burkholderiaceae bacterium]|jgi:ComF family protein|nr:ComF family protein [Burkholderiaceae bacterium]MCO5105265.1 ComF family protein [Burkholderiaceae bacterium]
MARRRFLASPWRSLGAWTARLPSRCAVCGSWPAERLCAACIARFAQPAARCSTCALPLAAGAVQCGQCLRDPPPLDACIAALDYAYPWAGLLAEFKFHGDPSWAQPLADLMRSTPWAEPAIDAADWLIPVPLSPARLGERGFNQAERLAHALCAQKTSSRLLLRLHCGADQHTLGRAERLRNLQGAFAVDPLRVAALHGRRAVLVDDVMTTGATLHAAAQVLRQAGVTHLTALVFARAPEPGR